MNWIGVSRSNYFRVKDPAAFLEHMNAWGADTKWKDAHTVAVFGATDGEWPTWMDENGDPDDDLSFIQAVASHLADGEVAVFMTTGAEGQRYVTGHATAIINTGEEVSINLDTIYGMARQSFGVEPTRAEY